MNRIVTRFTRSNEELDTTSQRVVDNMENNPVFLNPPASLAELKKVLPEFRTSLANAKGRDKKMVSIKNDKKAILLALLQELSAYVTVTCNGDRTLMLSSGFDVTSESRNGMAPSIEKLEVVLGEAGEATMRSQKVTAVKAYIHQYTTEPPGPNTVWVQEGSSQCSHTFTGLTSEKRHWFRAVAIGYGKQKTFSPIVSRVIQ